jgi:hypoxanthine phosphoribosyltransferase
VVKKQGRKKKSWKVEYEIKSEEFNDWYCKAWTRWAKLNEFKKLKFPRNYEEFNKLWRKPQKFGLFYPQFLEDAWHEGVPVKYESWRLKRKEKL